MTWKEFKAAVDKMLAEDDISEDTKIWYIDISFPDADDFEKGRIWVSAADPCGISVA